MNDFILNNTNSKSDNGILIFLKKFINKKNISFTTSGTSGLPKKITHSHESLVKNVIIKNKFKNVVWALTYDYSKIAGSQVILQSYLNDGKIVNLIGKTNKEIVRLIKKYNVSHISATPTFYRLLNGIFENVKQVTVGGECVDEIILKHIKILFPNAKITNIYALTEFGTVLTSHNEFFHYSKKVQKNIKIIDNTIIVKKNNKLINTGDKIEWINNKKFKIVGREINMINVGGVKVNPLKIESIINNLDYVFNSYVYGKKNSVVGTIVVTDIVLKQKISHEKIKNDLKNKLSKYEMPLKINFVTSIKLNSNRKIIRK